jgi:hypothetical protein
MTFLAAAEEVLRASGRPMTAREITEIALERGFLRTRGRTPEASMSAVLYAAATDGRIRRTFAPGRGRAARGSVRWAYVPPRSDAASEHAGRASHGDPLAE